MRFALSHNAKLLICPNISCCRSCFIDCSPIWQRKPFQPDNEAATRIWCVHTREGGHMKAIILSSRGLVETDGTSAGTILIKPIYSTAGKFSPAHRMVL
jgi:hypothetical protein